MDKIGIKNSCILIGLFLLSSVSQSQSFQYQPDKLGKYIFNNQLDKYPGVDVATLKNNLTTVVKWEQLKDSVLNRLTGFNTLVNFPAYCFDRKSKIEDYGIRGSIKIDFYHFFIENGVACRANNNSAHSTRFNINQPISFIRTRFDETKFKTGNPPHLKLEF